MKGVSQVSRAFEVLEFQIHTLTRRTNHGREFTLTNQAPQAGTPLLISRCVFGTEPGKGFRNPIPHRQRQQLMHDAEETSGMGLLKGKKPHGERRVLLDYPLKASVRNAQEGGLSVCMN